MAGLYGLRTYVQWLLALQRGEERVCDGDVRMQLILS